MSTPADDAGEAAEAARKLMAAAPWNPGRESREQWATRLATTMLASARAEADKLRADVQKVYDKWIERSLGPNGDEFIAMVNSGRREILSDLRPILPADPVSLADVRVEWGVDLGHTIAQVLGEEQARRWVQSWIDHPDDDPKPKVVRRTVATSEWAVTDHG